MLRKQVLRESHIKPCQSGAEKDVATLATVLVTSEDPQHPIDHVFDHRRGPGGSRWIAEGPGEQTVILAFDTPQTIRRLVVEIEEPDVSRTQELQVSVSRDGGRAYRELLRQEYNFSPPGTTFEREEWVLPDEAVSHLKLTIKPDKGGGPYRATLTSLALE